eukprot:s2_g48.t1
MLRFARRASVPAVPPWRWQPARYQGQKGPATEDDLNPAKCPIFAAAGEPKGPPSRTLRIFRMVPKDVVQSIHSLYWILIGGPVPRHLQERSFATLPSVELLVIRLTVRLLALLGFGFGARALLRFAPLSGGVITGYQWKEWGI